MEKIVGTF